MRHTRQMRRTPQNSKTPLAWLAALVVGTLAWSPVVMAQATFNEAPILAEQVANGDLPPVTERLPEDPYVVTPVEEIGQFGGTARVASIRADGHGDDLMMMSHVNGLVQPDPRTSELNPHFAREIDVSDDYSTYTIHFRRGVRWSDGTPFTTEDVMFWHDSILQNLALTPSIASAWLYEGELAAFEALDDHTLRVTFAGSKPFFLESLVDASSQLLQPKHYLSQFHIDYVSEDEMAQLLSESGFEQWFELFQHQNERVSDAPLHVDRPTMNSYVLAERTSEFRVYERNPYYWKVDTEGNQLPYIDTIFTEIVPNREILNGMIISGDLDFAGFENDVRNFPLYRSYEEAGNYRVLLWQSGMGSEVIYQLNLTHEDETLRAIFQDVRFRRALSLAINREEINQEIYFGQAIPRQYTVLPNSQYFREDYATAYTAFDPAEAETLLDEMGLEVDASGYRLRPDGERLSFTVEVYDSETPKSPNVELVTEHWQDLGLDVSMRPISGDLQFERAPANLMDASVWHGDGAADIGFPSQPWYLVPWFPPDGWTMWNTEWARWYTTGGEQGEEPPDEVAALHDWWSEIMVTTDAERRVELTHKILQSQAENLWVIGTVGEAPYPLVVRNTLRNVPDESIWAWDFRWSSTWDPEQWFFAQE